MPRTSSISDAPHRVRSALLAALVAGAFACSSADPSAPDAAALDGGFTVDAEAPPDAGSAPDADVPAPDAGPAADAARPTLASLSPTWTSTFGNPVLRGRRIDLWGSIAVVEGRNLYLFGGNGYPNGATMERHWVMSLDDGAWTELAPGPARRYCHCATLLPDTREILLVGGRNDRAPIDGDAWVYAIDADTWTRVEGDVPPAPIGCVAAWMPNFPGGGRAIVFGGDGFQGVSQATWAFDPSARRFTALSPATSPPARRDPMMAFDPGAGGAGRLVLFGGSRSVQPPVALDDTWAFDGTTWSELAVGADRPSPRRYAASAFMPEHRYWVLFGGTNDVASSDELWAFDATIDRWRRLPAADPTPTGRGFAMMSWDAMTSSFLLLGGIRFENYVDVKRGWQLRVW
jgi:hypothetical protein